jgi:hypothetical protein
MQPSRSCIICGSDAHVPRDGTCLVCRRPSCQWTFNSTPVHARCISCERPLTPQQMHVRRCAQAACQSEMYIAQTKYSNEVRRKARADFLERATRVRAEAGRAMGIDAPDDYVLARLPHNEARPRRLPARRRARYLAHVRQIATGVVEARTRGEPAPATDLEQQARHYVRPMSDELSAVAGQGCAQCRGNCCSHADTHAYLNDEVIARYLERHPDAGVEDVVAAYASYLPQRSMENGCVNQGTRGCVLPREMRAAICNLYYCGGLRELFDALETKGDAPTRVFYELDADAEHRYAFVDARDVRVVRRTVPADPT